MRVLLLILLMCPPLLAADREPTVTGTVIDAHGQPVPGATVCSQWRLPEPGISGQPLLPSTKTDAAGHFAQTWIGSMRERVTYMVYDSTQKLGALVDMPADDASKPVTVKLRPLHQVHFALETPVPPATNQTLGHIWTHSGAVVGAVFSTRGSLLLPSGQYELSASTDDTDPERQSFLVADSDVTLPPLKLTLSPMAQHYGHGTPELSTLRDMNHESFEIGPFRVTGPSSTSGQTGVSPAYKRASQS
jgi:hypothetical protein